jgi:organic hydroperoxide reductase OsmC/OhrA
LEDVLTPPSDVVQAAFAVTIASEGPTAWIERTVALPGSNEELVFGVRPEFAAHYGVAEDRFPPRPTTNDVFAAAVASCMTGTFVGILESRGVALAADAARATVAVDMGPAEADGVSIVRAIDVTFHVRVPEESRALVERVHGFYDKGCWLSQTLVGSRCKVTSQLRFEEVA